jgi:serine/threonine protein phosphatase PrpC
MGLLAAGLTDIGQKRKTNQDAIYLNREGRLFLVADGMGGHNGGDIASSMAVKYIPQYLLEHFEDDPIVGAKAAVNFANDAIKAKGKEDAKLVGMGTTSVMAYLKGNIAYLANVGDSRGYLINCNKIYQLTCDHSLVQERLNMAILANLGDYTRVDAANDPQKNVIVRTVGFEENVDADVFSYRVNRYDMLLLCSDGLHGKVCDEDIIHIINRCIPDPAQATQESVQQAVTQLVKQANDNGGNDNISVILVLAN